MIIKKQTIEELANQGITVKNYPDATYQHFYGRIWAKNKKSNIEYNRNCHHYVNGEYKVYTEDELEEHAIEYANMYTERECNNWYNYQVLYIEYRDGDNERLICKKIAVKSKEITVDMVNKIIAKDKKQYAGTYGKFADAVNKILRSIGRGTRTLTCSVYPTTYGIGVWNFFNFHFDSDCKDVSDILKRNNIEYKNEYSDKRWAYRYIISKEQANLKLCLNAV
jgi:hypothetical protein